MLELFLFTAVFAAIGVFDVKRMLAAGQKRDVYAYLFISVIVLAVAAMYFPAPNRHDIVYYIMKLAKIKD
jgi:hypothetical protein